jgi:XTP/dITP diphosphohydrolase
LKLLVATRSHHKMREIREILASVPDLSLLSLDDVGLEASSAEDVIEAFDTFEENALAKAAFFHARTGLPTVADDSGIEVDAIGGAPGVRSKRFAPVPPGTSADARDRANNDHLLRLLMGTSPAARTARYVCVVALKEDATEGWTVRGESEGTIAQAPRGSGGFGYDPLFIHAELGRTFGEAAAEEKHALSHRGAAFRKLAEHLAARATHAGPTAFGRGFPPRVTE